MKMRTAKFGLPRGRSALALSWSEKTPLCPKKRKFAEKCTHDSLAFSPSAWTCICILFLGKVFFRIETNMKNERKRKIQWHAEKMWNVTNMLLKLIWKAGYILRCSVKEMCDGLRPPKWFEIREFAVWNLLLFPCLPFFRMLSKKSTVLDDKKWY